MKKNFRNFCNGDGSTSTLDQKKANFDISCIATPSLVSSTYVDDTKVARRTQTLEEMIRQLEIDEAAARKTKLDEYGEVRRRMSCVNNSDVLRSARNALNQYPRFSLDGRDSMYRSTFRNFTPVVGKRDYERVRRSSCCRDGFESLPSTLAGESVLWCKPGVVAKLMGLEAMPIPLSKKHHKGRVGSSTIRTQNLRRAERVEMERRVTMDGLDGYRGHGRFSGTKTNYCMIKPVSNELRKPKTGWQI
ncbi:hypothetical protein GIB67_037753 [Kingdonia uniflora]|uniref:DUF3741 domain-containing protein n=1 Tax=Kingdonia uniflora TaxID=39325 RepID=A0A7J7LUX3_9MAGN|nr:hypothetical protein GIB67_037753 [Kingdonia uniflora]